MSEGIAELLECLYKAFISNHTAIESIMNSLEDAPGRQISDMIKDITPTAQLNVVII